MGASNSTSIGPNTVETAAVCQMEAVSMVHCVKITGYSLCKEIGRNNRIECSTFTLDGHRWGLYYDPDNYYDNVSYVGFHLVLLSQATDYGVIRVAVEFSLVEASGRTWPNATENGIFTYKRRGESYGFERFMRRFDVEFFRYIKDDCLTLRCTLRIIKSSHKEVKKAPIVIVPPSDLHQHFGHLLETGEGADVIFKVENQDFAAHKFILAARSPVFRAQLYGSMAENKLKHIKVEDIKAVIFKATLHFIYTDSLPQDCVVSCEMAQHLLVAADRYGLQRMKLICEEKLYADVSVATAATTLALAEQHNCQQLKAVCLDFIASPEMLHAVMATDGFKHLMLSCPMISKELLEKVDRSRRM